MIVDGTSVKVGDKIYELILLYIPEKDTVIGVGVNLEGLICAQPKQEAKAESQAKSELKSEPEAEVQAKPKPKPKQFITLYEQERKRLRRLRHFPEVNVSLHFKDWGKKGEVLGSYETGPQDNLVEFSGGFDTLTELGEGMLTSSDVNYIEDGTVINTNTIWDSNVCLLGYVFVDNAMLVIKPGVTIWIESGFTPTLGGIRVRNNGCIIANGTPSNEINGLQSMRDKLLRDN
jgi:hypothetical protein